MSIFDLDIVDLPHQVGSTKDMQVHGAVTEPLGTDVIGVPAGAQVSMNVSLISVEDGVLVRGQATLPIHGECVRCLRDIDEERTVHFDELYFTPEAAQRQRESEDEEAEEFFLLGETTLDVEPALRDALVLELPFRPLCEPDCAGLCPECGERLADLPEDHHHEILDPRWSALAGLLGDEDASGTDAKEAE